RTLTSSLNDQFAKRRRDIDPVVVGGRSGHADDIQSAGQVGFALAERFTDPPFDMVSTHGVPDALADADPNSRISQVVSYRINHEHRICDFALAA
ncbi:MAG: hypothetical protein AAB363_06840, partial [Planctomycetota bacterium]